MVKCLLNLYMLLKFWSVLHSEQEEQVKILVILNMHNDVSCPINDTFVK